MPKKSSSSSKKSPAAKKTQKTKKSASKKPAKKTTQSKPATKPKSSPVAAAAVESKVQKPAPLAQSAPAADLPKPDPSHSEAVGSTPALSPTTESKPIGGSHLAGSQDITQKPHLLQIALLLLIGLSTFLSVMWFNERQARQAMVPAEMPKTSQAESTSAPEYELPAVKPMADIIALPEPELASGDSLTSTLQNRRSRRVYAENRPVLLTELSQVLWAAQGETDDQGHRAAPSAKGAYPYTLYVVVRNVDGLEPGMYQYLPEGHQLGSLQLANAGALLTEAGVQENSQTAPVVVVMAAAKAKMLEKFPDSNPDKNTYLEGGHIGQNIYLQVEDLGLATVVTGGFNPVAVNEALQLDPAEEVVYLVPFGHRPEASLEPVTDSTAAPESSADEDAEAAE